MKVYNVYRTTGDYGQYKEIASKKGVTSLDYRIRQDSDFEMPKIYTLTDFKK